MTLSHGKLIQYYTLLEAELKRRGTLDGDCLPQSEIGWSIASSCGSIPFSFIKQYYQKLHLSKIIANDAVAPYTKEAVAEYFPTRINWAYVAEEAMYRPHGMPQPPFTSGRKKTLELLCSNAKAIPRSVWKKISTSNSNDDSNEDFLIALRDRLVWLAFLSTTRRRVSKKALTLADEKDYIDWKRVSAMRQFPEHFLRDNQEQIDWNIFLNQFPEEHLKMIPADCFQSVPLIIAIRNNPDLLAMVPDKSIYSSLAENLRRLDWIDRAPVQDRHFSDDSGRRIDQEEFSDLQPDLSACGDHEPIL